MNNVVSFNRMVNSNTQATGSQKLQLILNELQNEVNAKKDFMIHPADIRMTKEGKLRSRGKELNDFHVTDWALGQLSYKLEAGLPIRYLRKCPPALQAVNVNHWIQKFEENKDKFNPWLVRTQSGQNSGIVRGLLSERYSPFDDHEIMNIIHQFLGDSQANTDVKWWYRDDTGFHLRVVFDDLTTTIGTTPDGTPDVHKVGLHIENSEVGKKSLKITPLIWRLVCSNGMMGWATDGDIFKQRHLYLKPHEMYGRVVEAIGNALKVGDASIEKLVQAKETPVENPLDVIAKLSEKYKYSKEFTEKAQGKFMEEEGNNAFYVLQAFTRACQDSGADFRTGVETDSTKMLEELIKVS
jgi:hypothetical protein